MKVNIGCGETKLEGFINVDIEESTKPDIICDFRKERLPFKEAEVELVHMMHSIEHIELKYWPQIFLELNRVLCTGGILRLAYPEWEVCAKYYLENHKGQRDFWRATLYGRQLYPGDYHVTPVRTEELIVWLQNFGFNDIKHTPEPDEIYNTFLQCKRGPLPDLREDILKREIFGGAKA